ncbi:MAG: methyltransferase domain-containing protein [Kiritimatiellae bacterium]|nr:methyltransferase domain-containing protein [Kiritimatiellia bacterium]
MKKMVARESFITYTNSQKIHVRGTLMHVTGQTAVFEAYNPFSILQLSEVLNDFNIIMGDRQLYSGKAVVSSLVNTGIMLVIETTLLDPWSEVDPFSILQDRAILRRETERFIADWESSHHILPNFKVLIGDYRNFLAELSIWLQQIELGVKSLDKTSIDKTISELVYEVAEPVRPILQEFLGQLETIITDITPELEGLHKSYTRREIHPLILCSPFVHRTYTKPLGYAGDYGMINMILGDARKGKSLFAKTINALFLEAAPSVAHQNRILVLRELLEKKIKRRSDKHSGPLKVLNVACGPAKEVRDFIQLSPCADDCEMTLLDFSPEALHYAERSTKEVLEASNCKMKLHVIEKSVDQLLRESIGQTPGQSVVPDKYDYVYCAGLFDYLTSSVCQRLTTLFYKWVRPGGLVAITNLHTSNPAKGLMEYILEWNVVHRSEQELKRLVTTEGVIDTFADKTGVNAFITVRKQK